MFAVRISPKHVDGICYNPRLVKTCDFGGRGSFKNPKTRTWATEAAAKRFAAKLHESQAAEVVEI